MAISRSVGVRPGGYFGPLSQLSAFAKTGGEIFHFVSTGANPNDVTGATYRVHVFDSVGDNLINFERDGFVDVFLIAGGGAGGAGQENDAGGGGGAGGLVTQYGLGISAGTHLVSVGRSGIGVGDDTDDLPTFTMGKDSYFAGITAFGGGGGGSRDFDNAQGGGSGGGSGSTGAAATTGGTEVLGQGRRGGGNVNAGETAAGGGGAGEPGTDISDDNVEAPDGGDGLPIAFYDNVERYYSGGGAGASMAGRLAGTGGLGGGANSSSTDSSQPSHATFYGGGGAGGSTTGTTFRQGGNGYQGLVMIRYRIY